MLCLPSVYGMFRSMARNILKHPKVKKWFAGKATGLAASAAWLPPLVLLQNRALHTGVPVYVPRAELLIRLAYLDLDPVPVLSTPDCMARGGSALHLLAELFYIVPSRGVFGLLYGACKGPADYARLFDTRQLATLDPLFPADLREFCDVFDSEFELGEMLSWVSDRVHRNRCEMPGSPDFEALKEEPLIALAAGYE